MADDNLKKILHSIQADLTSLSDRGEVVLDKMDKVLTFQSVVSEQVRFLKDQFSVMNKKIDAQGKVLDEHTKLLDDHTRTLDELTRILDEQAKTLKKHTKVLEEHTKLFEDRVLPSVTEIELTVKSYKDSYQGKSDEYRKIGY